MIPGADSVSPEHSIISTMCFIKEFFSIISKESGKSFWHFVHSENKKLFT
jgi:hypothetical protein